MASVSHLSLCNPAGDSASASVSEFFAYALQYLMDDSQDKAPSVDELATFFASLSGVRTGELFFGAIESLISHFVRVDKPDHKKSLNLTGNICRAVMGLKEVAGWSASYENIVKLRQAYWDAVNQQIRSRIDHNRTHRVIRINDIPFAEAVFPALLSWHSNKLGYTVLIEDIPWKEVGAALLNHRIDVAIYPAYAKEQIKLVDTVFERKNIYRSPPLMFYKDYPVIQNQRPNEGGRSRLGVPARSDFVPVLKEAGKNGYIEVKLGNSRISKISMSAVSYFDSADAVSAKVVNGELEFGMVGGLQAEYVRTQYDDDASASGPCIQICDNLNRKDDKGEVFFWAAVSRRDEAESLLGAMVSLWNELVVQGWHDIVNCSLGEAGDCERAQRRLVGMVNAQTHRAFVSDFHQLKTLIERHDCGLEEPVPRLVEPVRV